jgi:hypothetical protein
MVRRWFGSAGILAVMLWVLAGCTATDTGSKAPLVPAAEMKTVTLTVQGMT